VEDAARSASHSQAEGHRNLNFLPRRGIHVLFNGVIIRGATFAQ
jgi:hypothetical protein